MRTIYKTSSLLVEVGDFTKEWICYGIYSINSVNDHAELMTSVFISYVDGSLTITIPEHALPGHTKLDVDALQRCIADAKREILPPTAKKAQPVSFSWNDKTSSLLVK